MQQLVLGRIAKFVALLGFFLPWVAVSCSGTDILQATGLQLMTGDVHMPQGFPGAGAESGADVATESPKPNPFVIAAFAVLALGFVAALLTRSKIAAGVMLTSAVLGIGLSYYSVENMRQELVRSMNDEQAQQQQSLGAEGGDIFTLEQQAQMAQAVSTVIQVRQKEGFWVTLGGAGLAAILAVLVLAGGVPARRPEEAQGG